MGDTSAQGSRLCEFDLAKGIGILCIVIGHMGMSNVNRFIWIFHVPIFYFIAGYFLSFRGEYRDFVKKKASGLLIPYGTACLLVAALSLVRCRILNEPVFDTLKMWLFAALYGSGIPVDHPFAVREIGAIWFLPALFWGVILARYFARRKYGFVFFLLAGYVGWRTSQTIQLPWSIQAGLVASGFVYLGCLAKENAIFEKELKLPILFGMLCVLAWEVKNYVHLGLVQCFFGNGWMDIISAAFASYLIVEGCRRFLSRTRLIRSVLLFYGKNSLCVLTFHVIELDLFPYQWLEQTLTARMWIRPQILLLELAMKMAWVTLGVLVLNAFPLTRDIYHGKFPAKKAEAKA